LTVAALEERFFSRLCDLIERPHLVASQYDAAAQGTIAAELTDVFARRSLAAWLELFDGEDVSVGPVATLEEGAAAYGDPARVGAPPALGEHTAAWRRELGL
jgi:crotonobetainyl-CoA:carnitine CoA-transferase CaiB-like acyl-CoA transferase